MENIHKDKLSKAIKEVLKDMESLSREDFQAEIAKYMAEDRPKYQPFDEVGVEFAFGFSVVVIQSVHRAWDGVYIYHVKDEVTGHEDFVGQDFIRQL